jgi:UDP-2,3-diacylglucosamine hydrolase
MRIFLSDLHLEDPESAVFGCFRQLLQRESERVEAIFILGDLTEVWVGDDDDGPLAVALRAVLADAASRTRVAVMHGNRDFLFGPRLAAETGIELIEDPLLLPDATLLAHGDAFCLDDEAYQQIRALFRSEAWQTEMPHHCGPKVGRPTPTRRRTSWMWRAGSWIG